MEKVIQRHQTVYEIIIEMNHMVGNITYSISNSKPVDYKASITGRSQATDIDSNVETPVPLIFFNIFYNCVI